MAPFSCLTAFKLSQGRISYFKNHERKKKKRQKSLPRGLNFTFLGIITFLLPIRRICIYDTALSHTRGVIRECENLYLQNFSATLWICFGNCWDAMAQMPLAVCGIFVMLLGFVASSAEGKLPRLNCIIPSRYHDKFYYNRLSRNFFLPFFFFPFPSPFFFFES